MIVSILPATFKTEPWNFSSFSQVKKGARFTKRRFMEQYFRKRSFLSREIKNALFTISLLTDYNGCRQCCRAHGGGMGEKLWQIHII